MAFCSGCGKELVDGAKFCTSCGTQTAASPGVVLPKVDFGGIMRGAANADADSRLLAIGLAGVLAVALVLGLLTHTSPPSSATKVELGRALSTGQLN